MASKADKLYRNFILGFFESDLDLKAYFSRLVFEKKVVSSSCEQWELICRLTYRHCTGKSPFTDM